MLRLLALLAFALLPAAAQAQDQFFLRNEGPSLNGVWQIRSFTISSEGADSWGEPSDSTDQIAFTEADDGRLTGTMTLHGDTFPITGQVDYGTDRVIVTWSGEPQHDGRILHRTFQAFALPLYASADEQVDMLAGTSGVVEAGQTFGASGSFIAVQAEY
jgi:hypothetical protein